MLSSFFHEAHEYFTYLHPHPLFFLTNFQTVWICISHGSWLGDAACSSEASAGGCHGDLQQDFNDDTTSGSLKSACLEGYFTAAKCEVGYIDSQPRGRYQSPGLMEALVFRKGSNNNNNNYYYIDRRGGNFKNIRLHFPLIQKQGLYFHSLCFKTLFLYNNIWEKESPDLLQVWKLLLDKVKNSVIEDVLLLWTVHCSKIVLRTKLVFF